MLADLVDDVRIGGILVQISISPIFIPFYGLYRKTEVHMHGSEGISLEVYVTVENTVEDEAFEAGLEIIIPEGTTYRKIYDVKAVNNE